MWKIERQRERDREMEERDTCRERQRTGERWGDVCVYETALSSCFSPSVFAYILVTMFAWQVFLSMSHLTSLSNTFSVVPWTLQSSWSQPWSPWSWLLRSTPAPRSLCSSVFLKTQIQISFPRLLTLQCHLGGIFPNVPLHSHKLQLCSRPPVHAVLQNK